MEGDAIDRHDEAVQLGAILASPLALPARMLSGDPGLDSRWPRGFAARAEDR
jgi:hypothetical protein